jgi:hypothetical protein
VVFRVAIFPFFAGAEGFAAAAAAFPRGLDRTGASALAAGFLGVADLVGLLVLFEAK